MYSIIANFSHHFSVYICNTISCTLQWRDECILVHRCMVMVDVTKHAIQQDGTAVCYKDHVLYLSIVQRAVQSVWGGCSVHDLVL